MAFIEQNVILSWSERGIAGGKHGVLWKLQQVQLGIRLGGLLQGYFAAPDSLLIWKIMEWSWIVCGNRNLNLSK